MYCSHEELHVRMDRNPELKDRSDRVHRLPKAASPEEYADRKIQMFAIYAAAVGCGHPEWARQFLVEVLPHVYPHFAATPAAQIRDKYANERKCHSPGGNDYLCYCNEIQPS